MDCKPQGLHFQIKKGGPSMVKGPSERQIAMGAMGGYKARNPGWVGQFRLFACDLYCL